MRRWNSCTRNNSTRYFWIWGFLTPKGSPPWNEFKKGNTHSTPIVVLTGLEAELWEFERLGGSRGLSGQERIDRRHAGRSVRYAIERKRTRKPRKFARRNSQIFLAFRRWDRWRPAWPRTESTTGRDPELCERLPGADRIGARVAQGGVDAIQEEMNKTQRAGAIIEPDAFVCAQAAAP